MVRTLLFWLARNSEKDSALLKILFDRNRDIVVTESMLRAARCVTDMEILLKRMEPSTQISTDVFVAVSTKIGVKPLEMMLLMLNFEPSICLDSEQALQAIGYIDTANALELPLEYDPSMLVTAEMFLRIFSKYPMARENNREQLAHLIHKYGKRIVFIEEIREAVDHAYQKSSDVANKKRFYELNMAPDEDGETAEGDEEEDL